VYLRVIRAGRYGVFALILVLLLWFYYLAEIVLLGVALNGTLARRARERSGSRWEGPPGGPDP
jgi:Ribonuclease BN-like family.